MQLSIAPASITVEHAGARLDLSGPTVVLADMHGAVTTLSPTGSPRVHSRAQRSPVGDLVQTTWTWDLTGGHQLAWTVGKLADGSGVTLSMAFRNGSSAAVRLRELRTAEGAMSVTGDPSAWLLTTFAYSRRVGTLASRLISVNEDERRVWAGFGLPVPFDLPAVESAEDGRWRSFQDYAIVAGQAGALALGAIGSPEASLRLDFIVDGAHSRLAITSEMTDVEVAPGAWRHGQDLAILGGVQAEISERLLRWVAVTHGARTHLPPASGWCSWYHHGTGVAASDAIAIADHVQKTGLAMPVIQIDDGFQRQVGDWACNDRFPDGWQPVIERIRAAGSVPGVWLAPLAVHESTALFHDHPDWFQRDVAGALAGEANNWGPRSRWLDPTHPGTAAWIRQLIREHRGHGFRYFKIDFNTVSGVSSVAPQAARLHDRSRTAFQALRDLYRLYREEMGEDSYLLACIGFNRAVVGLADAARIGPDSASNWQAAHPCCIHECILAVGQNAQANGILFANDPDVSYTRPRGDVIETELRTWHGFVGLLGGLSLVSEPLWMTEQQAGRARLELSGDRLCCDLQVRDAELILADPPWLGSNVDIFADHHGKVVQYWLQPGLAGQPARALRRQGEGFAVEPAIVVRSQLCPGGYRMEIEAPLAVFGEAADAASLRCEVKYAAVPTISVPAVQRQTFMVFGAPQPWSTVVGYGTVTRGAVVERTVSEQGWSGTDRMYELIAPPVPESGVSLDGSDPEHRRFGFVAHRPWGDFAVAQLWNPLTHSVDLQLDVEGLLGRPCHVWSFWDGVCHGIHSGRFTARDLPTHGSVVLRLTPVDATVPVIIGSDLHLGCGAAELAAVESTSSSLRVRLHDAGACDGALWVAWTGTLRVTGASGCTATAERAADGCWRIVVGGRRHGVAQEIVLAC